MKEKACQSYNSSGIVVYCYCMGLRLARGGKGGEGDWNVHCVGCVVI